MPLPKLTQCRSKAPLKKSLTPRAKPPKTLLAPLKVAKLLAAPKVVKLPSAKLLSAKLLSNQPRNIRAFDSV